MKLYFFKRKQIISIWIFLLAGIFNQVSAQSNANCNPIPEVKFPGGRVVMSFDGNVHDDDDIIAMPFAAALWWAAGLKDKVVQIEYNNHVCDFNKTENDNYGPGTGDDSQNMRISAEGAISRFDYNPNVFFDFEKQATASTNKMAEEIEKSTASNPLWILAGGPMETIYRGMNKATKGHKHVTIISHGIFNQNHDHCNGKTWEDLKAKFGGTNQTFFVEHCKNNCNAPNKLPTQNGGFNSKRGFDWMKNNANPDLDWVYRRNPFSNKVDPSDAGMSYYLITGGPFNNGKKNGNPKDARKLLENPCTGGNNNNNAVSGGNVSTNNGSTMVATITGDGIEDLIRFKTTSNASASYIYVITDEAGKILTTEQASHDFEDASVGICKVYGLSYKGTLQLTGKNINASGLSSDQFSVSANSIIVTRKEDATGGGCDDVTVATLSEDAFLQGSTRFNTKNLKTEAGKRTSYLKFTIPTTTATVTSATLELTVSTDAGNGLIEIFKGSSNNWTQANLSNNNKPTEGTKLGSLNTSYKKNKSYQWNLSGVTSGETLSLIVKQTGGNDVSFSSKEGSKAPKLTLKLDCNTTSKLSVKKPNANLVNVKVFPNPAKDFITISGVNKGDQIVIYNTLGKIVMTKISKEKEEIMDMSGFASGLYIIKIPGKRNFQLVKE